MASDPTNRNEDGPDRTPQDEPERVISGVPRLDFILQGGLLRGGMYVIMGPPGSGKTILGNQMCFNHISRDGGQCVFVSLLTESHSKMIRHIKNLSFFNADALASARLNYVSGYRVLEKEGLKGLLEMCRRAIQEKRASVFVMDGLESIAELAKTEQEFKKFLHELQAVAALLDCTLLLLTPLRASHPEANLADGVIELSLSLIGPRAVRELTVHKFRGSNFLPGRHEVEITQKGLQIHPRTEVQFSQPPEHAEEKRIRMGFGIPKLDDMLGGGPLSGSSTALLGAPGTGKTLLGLSFLVEGARQGHCGIYFGFFEPPPRLMEKAAIVGIELERYVKEGMIELIWQPPLEHYLDSLAEQLLERIRGERRPRLRLFIDGIEGFRAASIYPERMGRFLSALTNQLRMEDVTTIISEELGLFKPEVDMPNPELGNVVESVILLRLVELRSQLHRLISVLKMRESRYDTSIREFKILDSGVDVAASFDSAEAILSGHARIIGSSPAPGAQTHDDAEGRRS